MRDGESLRQSLQWIGGFGKAHHDFLVARAGDRAQDGLVTSEPLDAVARLRASARAGWREVGATVAIATLLCAGAPRALGATIAWKGHTWQLTSGGMAGACQGDPNNVTIDASGYLHLRISNNAGAWSAAELFTTDKLGFGTYQWQVDGPIDSYDKNVVLGLFPYGPAAGIGADGTNEIDIEYARWGQATGPNGDWTDYPASGTTIGELSYTFSLGGGTLSTSRFVWSTTAITDFLFSGLVGVDATSGAIKTWTYMPANPGVNIPQQALPLGMNLWCFNAPPSDGKAVEVVIRDFAFVAEGASSGNAGSGGGGGGAAGGTGGGAGNAGAGGAAGGTGGGAGRAGAGGAGASGGGAGRAGAAGASGGGAGSAGAAGASGGGAGSAGAAGASGGGAGSTGATGASGGGAGRAGAGGATGASGGGAGSAGATGASGGGAGGGSGAQGGAGATQAGGCGCAVASADADGRLGCAEAAIACLVLVGWRRRGRRSV